MLVSRFRVPGFSGLRGEGLPYSQDRISPPNGIAVKGLNSSYYIGKLCYLLYIPLW